MVIRVCLDICDRAEISKTRKSANLLKKKIAGNIVGKKDKDKGEFCVSQLTNVGLSTAGGMSDVGRNITRTETIHRRHYLF